MRGLPPLFAAMLMGAVEAEAQPAAGYTAALTWVRLPGAESCIAPQALARAVEARIGRPLLSPLSRAERAVEGRVERRGAAWVATLVGARDEGRTGERTVSVVAPDCAALDPQLVLVAALLLEDALPPSSTEPAVAPAPVAPATLAVPVAACPPPTPSPAASTAVPPARRFTLEAGAGFASGLLPALAPTWHVAATWSPSWPVVRLRAALAGVGPQRVGDGDGDGDATFLGAMAELDACFAASAAPWASLCTGVVVAALHGAGEGFARDASVWEPGVGVPLRARFEVPLGARWAVAASLGGVALAWWPRFAVSSDASGQVARDYGPGAPVAFAADVAVGYGWP
ncbi:MAG: hypothetical protein U0324_09060 [Polyangiales bacterium]